MNLLAWLTPIRFDERLTTWDHGRDCAEGHHRWEYEAVLIWDRAICRFCRLDIPWVDRYA